MLRVFLAVCAVYSVIVPAFFKLEVGTASQKETLPRENLKGHLRPFGESGSKVQVEERTEFLDPADFFTNYVKRSKPLKFSGVVRNSRAVRLWTDDNLLALDVPEDSVVQLETRKKEERVQEGEKVHFHEFLSIYNQTERYMVDDVPPYLRPDITVPCSLQCTELMERGLAMALMWFSSGGTKSFVHMDVYENVNCLIRGQKTFVMVDPARDKDKMISLLSDSTFSDIDVDSVDLTKYPLVAEVEFYHVNMTAGDCLFIPYTWYHQVRSYNSNVAVNFWWDHYAPVDLKADLVCENQCDPSLTLDKVGVGNFLLSFETTRDLLYEDVMKDPVTEDSFSGIIEENLPIDGGDVGELANKCFNLLDLDKDGVFTKEEYAKVPVETWKKVKELVSMAARSEEDAEEEESSREEL